MTYKKGLMQSITESGTTIPTEDVYEAIKNHPGSSTKELMEHMGIIFMTTLLIIGGALGNHSTYIAGIFFIFVIEYPLSVHLIVFSVFVLIITVVFYSLLLYLLRISFIVSPAPLSA